MLWGKVEGINMLRKVGICRYPKGIKAEKGGFLFSKGKEH